MRGLSGDSSIRALIPFGRAPPSPPDRCAKAQPSKAVTLGVRVERVNLEDTCSQEITGRVPHSKLPRCPLLTHHAHAQLIPLRECRARRGLIEKDKILS